jgi:queuine tRNA-ribosyltransferase
MPTILDLPHGALLLPVFLPDATRAVVRSVDSADLEMCGVEAVVMSTYHLMQNPGSSTIHALGGLHEMCGWQRPIITDSGGFQIYSLIRQNPRLGSLSSKGATFRVEDSSRKFILTPEKSIQLQLSYGADVVICLDDCTHVEDSSQVQMESVARTIAWAKRSKDEYNRRCERKTLDNQKIPTEKRQPLIFAVIQGGGTRELRKRCADELLRIGFDGYGFGGWPLDKEGHLLVDILAYTRELVPSEFPMHALGVAHPASVVECFRLGYNLFDGAMPTRDARHGRLYSFTNDTLEGEWFSYVYVNDDKHVKASVPISTFCDCVVCTRYSLGYLHHLFKIGDGLSLRLATIHNLRFMTLLVNKLK